MAAFINAERQVGEESPGSTESGCRVTPGGGNPRESATETNRRLRAAGKGEKVRQERTAALATRLGQANPTRSKTE